MSEDIKSKVRSQFGAAASRYVASAVHAGGESLGALLDGLQPQSHWTLMDVATGAGHTALRFAPRARRVVAVDLTAEMIAHTAALAAARGVGNLDLAVADAENLPFADASFDALTCRLSAHHFPDVRRALGEFGRTLKKGGRLGLADNVTVAATEAAAYYNAFEKLRDPSHCCVYSLDRLTALVTESGFKVEASRRLTKELEFHEWADRQNVSPTDKEELLRMVRGIPDALRPLLAPRWTDDTLYFTLWEAVLIARLRV